MIVLSIKLNKDFNLTILKCLSKQNGVSFNKLRVGNYNKDELISLLKASGLVEIRKKRLYLKPLFHEVLNELDAYTKAYRSFVKRYPLEVFFTRTGIPLATCKELKIKERVKLFDRELLLTAETLFCPLDPAENSISYELSYNDTAVIFNYKHFNLDDYVDLDKHTALMKLFGNKETFVSYNKVRKEVKS